MATKTKQKKSQKYSASRIERILRIEDNPYIPHEPTSKQWAFLLNDRLELLFGGAAGGGKSDGLLMGALMYVDDNPDYSAILFRRTYPRLMLPDSLIPRSHKWLSDTDAIWHGKTYTWEFPSGATLSFGHLQYDKSKYDYQSAAFQYIGFDELTEFPQSTYKFLYARLRRSEGSHIPLRMRSGSNPGGEGHRWVKESFIDSSGDNFIPATLDDNPYLDTESYKESLEHLDPVTRQMLLQGDWDVEREGALWKLDTIEKCRVNEYPDLVEIVVAVDPAVTSTESSDYTGIIVAGRDQEGICYIIADYTMKGTPNEWADRVVKAYDDHGADKVVGEINNGGDLVESNLRAANEYINYESVRASRGKQIRAQPVSNLYDRGLIKHVGNFDELESQMVTWEPGDSSPDNLDACVWAITELKGLDKERRRKAKATFGKTIY